MYDLDDILELLPYGNRECNCRLVYVYFAVIICLIFAYGLIMIKCFGEDRFIYVDFMNKVIVELPILGGIAGWPISHFICFFIAGLLFPNCFVLIFFLGVLWEIVETVLGTLNTLYEPQSKADGVLYHERWMSGRVEDIIFDMIGFWMGKLVIDSYRDYKYGNHKIYAF